MEYDLINCRPVPAKLAPELRALGFGDDIILTSCLRDQPAVDYARRHNCTLSSQVELWNGWLARLPGFNPANPPGRSTHELRNDGVAFRGWVGMRLAYYKAGIDCILRSGGPAVSTVRARAAKRGWLFTLTYPGAPREVHHGNFRREPRLFIPLRRGKRGPRVATLTARLAYLGFLEGVSPRRGVGGFGPKVEAAVKSFQHRYHLTADGVVGAHTHRQVIVAVRAKKRCRKAAKALGTHAARHEALARCDRRYGPE